MKPLLLAVSILSAFGGMSEQWPTWQPSPGHTQVEIWPGTPPDSQPVPGPEAAKSTGKEFLIAGRPVMGVSNVSQPTMTVYSPQGKNTGAAVIVFPGGGFEELAIDLEGTEVCDWLTPTGITCVLLKYRVPSPPYDWKCNCRPDGLAKPVLALEDAQRTMGLVRFHAAEWHIDPHKIGVLGFSAGGYLVAEISTIFERRLYPAVDAADKESCRPDFAVAIYPGHLEASKGLNPNVPVMSYTPPTFLLQAEDDHVDNVNDSLAYYVALKNAAVPVEMHLYARGGHAFGLRRTELPITWWPQLVETWLQTLGIISK
ncbi:MAG TPA: alpha/beta hydrolase [Candidatus Sulfotelmatobacter sp.]|nr:alpha/beta hydrolase [Candidatus Sulfotelmatobacter sp.]